MASDSNEAAYRKEQIDFVSNLRGTTARETLLLIMPSIFGLFLMVTTTCLLGKYLNRLTKFVLEFVIVLVPSILCCTIYSDYKLMVCTVLFVISCTNILLISLTTKFDTNAGAEPPSPRAKLPFLTNFRALTSVLTALCILAVDFKAFPRRYAKTEDYGFSLMDTGVGFFIMANALVSPEARDKCYGQKSSFMKTIANIFLDNVRTCTPLLVLGSARYFSVEYLNYQKQLTEYGVHWNFFITLAAVKILSSIVTSLISSKRSLIVGIIILVGYEYALSKNTFREWLFSSHRDGFVNANREGIVSTLGYVGLYFVGIAIGRLIHSTYQRASKVQSNKPPESTYFKFIVFEAQYSESMILCVKLSLIATQACAATLLLNGYIRVSRRLANAGYCAWMVTLTAVILTLLLLLDVITDIFRQLFKIKNQKGKLVAGRLSSIPGIFDAVNYNGLAFFLVSNLFTGAINMTVKTLYVADLDAVKILTVYMLIGTALFRLLHRYGIQIKL